MAEPKHTPGPWSVVRVHGELLGVGATEHPHPGVTVNRMVCNTIFDDDDVPMSQREADAHLLAASLKMRDALEALEWSHWRDHHRYGAQRICPACHGPKAEDHDADCTIDAALRAARGEPTDG